LKRKTGVYAHSCQTVEKARCAIFSAETGFSCTFGADGETRKETLLRKASEPTAHVAGFGLEVGGLRPSDTSHRLINKQKKLPSGSFFLHFDPFVNKR